MPPFPSSPLVWDRESSAIRRSTHFLTPRTPFTPLRFFVRPSKPVSSSRPRLISEATRAGGVKAGRDQRPPEGHGLDGAEHAAALGRVGMLGHFYYDLSSDDLWSESAFCSPQ